MDSTDLVRGMVPTTQSCIAAGKHLPKCRRWYAIAGQILNAKYKYSGHVSSFWMAVMRTGFIVNWRGGLRSGSFRKIVERLKEREINHLTLINKGLLNPIRPTL
jgi:hypothetical protein